MACEGRDGRSRITALIDQLMSDASNQRDGDFIESSIWVLRMRPGLRQEDQASKTTIPAPSPPARPILTCLFDREKKSIGTGRTELIARSDAFA